MKIFISYRRSDSEESAGRIYDRLVAAFGRDVVFKDVDSIPLQSKFADYIKSCLEKTKVVVVVIGPDWLNTVDASGKKRLSNPDDFVRIEILTALSLGIPLIPITVRNSRFPSARELPRCLRQMIDWNGHRIRPDPDFHKDVDSLINKLIAITDNELCHATGPLAESITTADPTSLDSEVSKFKQSFDNATFENAFDLLLEGEDLLVSLIGQERYNSLHHNWAQVQLPHIQMLIAERDGDSAKAASARQEATMALNYLKKRIRGIRHRQ